MLGFSCRMTLALSGLLFLSLAAESRAGFSALTKDCIDENGDQLCEGDWLECTIHVEVSGSPENFTLTDAIPGQFYTEWVSVTNAPPPATPCHEREGELLDGNAGGYCQQWVPMDPGASFDFVYRARVGANPFGTRSCVAARIGTQNLEEYETNEYCVEFGCVPPGSPNTLMTKEWLGPGGVGFGTPVTFELRVTNIGDADDTLVRVFDDVDPLKFAPPTVTYSRPPDSGGLSGNVLDATWDLLGVGEEIVITLDTVYANCMSGLLDAACNQATVFSDGITLVEPAGERLSDDPTTAARYGDPTCRAATPGGVAMLREPVVKEMIDEDGLPTLVGDFVTVRVTFINDRVCPAGGGAFTDVLDSGLDYVVGSATVTPDSGNIVWDPMFGVLNVFDFTAEPGETVIEFRVQVLDLGPGFVCNTGRWRYGIDDETDTTTACLGFIDTDADGVEDALDNCPLVPNGPAEDDQADGDADGVGDACDACPGFDDGADADGDSVADGCDICPGFDDRVDTDSDTVPNGCDVCSGFDDRDDGDLDTLPDGCDECAGFDDLADLDGDGVADGCDVCPGFDDLLDADADTVPDGCDLCAGFDDRTDGDADTIPDGCDLCPGFDDRADADGDTVADGCDVCPGFDDLVDGDGDAVADGCDNCAGVPNGPAEDDQANQDGDLTGDACDPCPLDPDDRCAMQVDVLRNDELDELTFMRHGTILTAGADPRLDPAADLEVSDVFSLTEVVLAGDAVTVGEGNPGVLVFYELAGWPGRLDIVKRGADVVLSGWP